MSQTIKKISVTYDAINSSNTFTCGDIVNGRVVVEVAKEAKIDSLTIKFKGKARVFWTERHGKTTHTYFDKEKYFDTKLYFIREARGNDDRSPLLTNESGQPYCNVVAPGTHTYPFSFQFPQQNLPAPVQGTAGWIAYLLEAKLSRSMRLSSKAKAEIPYIPRPDLTIPDLMVPQHGSKDKRMKVFTSGNVSFSIHTERMGYYMGERIKVVAEVQNNSSRELKLKYCLYEKISFFARHKRRLNLIDIVKEEGESIAQSTRQTVTKLITIPQQGLNVSVLDCRIVKVEHRLKVYLDVPYASDPEIKFPIVILPVPPASGHAAPPPAYSSDFGAWNTSGSPMAPPAWNSGAPYSAPQPAWNSVPASTPPPPPWDSGATPNAPPPAWSSAPPSAPPPSYDSYALYPPLPKS